MKTEKRIILTVLLTMTTSLAMNAQSNQTVNEAKLPPQATEVVVGVVSDSWDGGAVYDRWEQYWNDGLEDMRWRYVKREDHSKSYSNEQCLNRLKELATLKYGKSHPYLLLRDYQCKIWETTTNYDESPDKRNKVSYTYKFSASVVLNRNVEGWYSLLQALNKSLGNVRQGSTLAIDQISVPYSIDRNAFEDQIISILLDNGYKVAAKEQLERLYQELQDQQSGIYNDRTTVQENNFSAVGYFLNIRLTESSARVQVINVSTGEYEGNAIVNF